ncbi:phytoene desaturase family protein [Deinococcus maricopensis]|uniref:FAD dependent oxidoreductase n=1 Tax=Deinococcus maricopensis (strain DSM 21211 / LMG 22137 / NRRL B-23946 / LB-34) TaxID=709986 RepID=E8UAM0_DEIML|nr:FAD-dependent oxidoreductase [Deinococcus maricopensis]ADV68109.1 FAD dependent oxidoreductase [Deinococcus maricopensis DSM 21211]
MRTPGARSIGVLGGGLAGLALAALLARRGHAVTVYEAGTPGGKLRRLPVADLIFDTGPSLFTFPGVWRAYLERLGRSDPLDLRPLPGGLGVHHTPHGPVPLPVPPGHPLYPHWARYVRAAAPARDAITDLLTRPPRLTDPQFVTASARLGRVLGPHVSAHAYLRALRLPPALHAALATHALNAGVGPRSGSALYALLPALIAHDVARPAAGMGALLDTLLRFGAEAGVQVRSGTPVERLDVRRAEATLHGGATVRHDLFVSTLDPGVTARLLGRPEPRGQRSVSGLAIYAALPVPAPLPPTSVLLPDDLDALDDARRIPALPAGTMTLVHADGRQLSVLLTAPATGLDMDLTHPWVQGQLARVERTLGQPGLLASAQATAVLSPADYARLGTPGGAIYGLTPPAWRAGPFHPTPYRPHARVWQAGSGVHPGGGIPAVLGGALIVDTLMARSRL